MTPLAGLVDTSIAPDLSMTPLATENGQADPRDWPPNLRDKTVTVPPHPLKLKPAGNAYTSRENLRISLGSLTALTDELIIQTMEFLDGISLLKIGATCKALFAFASLEELWKSLFIGSVQPTSMTWQGTWRSTYLRVEASQTSRVCCTNLFSDVLHRPFFCANVPITPYTVNIPTGNAITQLPNLTPAEFSANWTDKPFILTEPVREWPVYKDWSTKALLEKYGHVKFRAEAVDWPLSDYVQYMQNNTDESPLYLFDRAFVEKMRLKVGRADHGEYWAPECFGEDLFGVLGDQRPDSRWLIVGPERSGSTFHKDPNATSAWNAVLRGSKYWIMFPSSPSFPPPPGVFVSEDQSEVTSPLSIAEWLITFHAEARRTRGCLEGVCTEGEVLHVPSGWWHLVVNLSPAIAITQNFIPRKHLPAALDFLKDKPNQVSGFPVGVADPFATFVQQLQQKHPHILEEALATMKTRKEGKKRKWDDLVKGNVESPADSGFNFVFGTGDDDDDIP
ncbi:MAG: hypothetical protein M1812_002892 [Candelaria pacifica]|nr:MAG: hypothetical protein M1812_002892 [Candelaria pacifica]